MPVENIEPIEIEGMPVAVDVTFSSRSGGMRVYRYVGVEAEAILAGANPSQFKGTRIA